MHFLAHIAIQTFFVSKIMSMLNKYHSLAIRTIKLLTQPVTAHIFNAIVTHN